MSEQISKAQVLSEMLIEEHSRCQRNGEHFKVGFDRILGDGAYDRLVSELYEELRAK